MVGPGLNPPAEPKAIPITKNSRLSIISSTEDTRLEFVMIVAVGMETDPKKCTDSSE